MAVSQKGVSRGSIRIKNVNPVTKEVTFRVVPKFQRTPVPKIPTQAVKEFQRPIDVQKEKAEQKAIEQIIRSQQISKLTPQEKILFKGGKPTFKSELEARRGVENVSALRKIRPQEVAKLRTAGINSFTERRQRQLFQNKPVTEQTIAEELNKGTTRKEILDYVDRGIKQNVFTSPQERRLKETQARIKRLEDAKKDLVRISGSIVRKPEQRTKDLKEVEKINRQLDDIRLGKSKLTKTELFKEVNRKAIDVETSIKTKELAEEQKTIKQIAKEFSEAKTPTQRGKLFLKEGLKKVKEEGYNALIKRGDDLMKQEKGFQFILGAIAKADKRDQDKAMKTLASDRFRDKAFNYLQLGLTQGKPTKFAKDVAKSVVERPLTMSQLAIQGLLASSIIKTTIGGGIGLAKAKGFSNLAKVLSATTQIATPGLKLNYANQLRKGYAKATNKNQYVIDSTAEYLAYGLLLGGFSPKKAFNVKKALATLNPFYRGDITVTSALPQTKSGKIAKTQGKTKNFFHVTSSKTHELIKKGMLEVISKKTGMGKDRIKFGEDQLFVSDKAINYYGIKGLKGSIKQDLDKELKSLILGEIKSFKNSDLLKKIKIRSKTKGLGELKIRNDTDRLLLAFAKKNKLIIGGQRASNLQLPKKYGRNTLDWDLTKTGASGKLMNRLAKEFVRDANKFYGFEKYNIKIGINGDLSTVIDKKTGDHIVDFAKPFFKQKFDNINGLRVVKQDILVERKIDALSTGFKQPRWTKDLKDLKSILKGTGNYDKYKQIIKTYEKEILKGNFDPQKAKYTLSMLKKLDFPDSVAKFMVDMKGNPLKYSTLKLIEKSYLLTAPTKYNIIEFSKMKVGKFPASLRKKINMESKLSQSQKDILRRDLVTFVKKNPGTVFPGTKTLSGTSEPFGLEEEWVIATGSKFGRLYNIRSRVLKSLGLTSATDYKAFDDVLDATIPVTTVGKNKSGLKSITKTFKLILKKYKNPKKLLKFVLDQESKFTITTDDGTKVTFDKRNLSPDKFRRLIDSLPFKIKRKFGFIGRQTEVKIPEDKVKQDKREIRKVKRRKIKFTRKVRRPTREIRTTRRIVRQPRRPRKPIPREPRRTPRTPRREPRTPRTPRVPPRTPRKPRTPRREPRTLREPRTPREPRPTPRTPRTPPRKPTIIRPPPIKFEIEQKPIKATKTTKKKKKKVIFFFTPTLAGLGKVAKQTEGTFTGFETRGSVIKVKPIKVKRHKRKTLKNKRFVRKHRRRKPINKK